MNAVNLNTNLGDFRQARCMLRRCIMTFTILLSFATIGLGREQREDGRIAALIAAVESLEGARFIRNGSDYDAKAAAEHLRVKLGKAGERVKTAEEFIDGCASRSSISGVKYRIRHADGKEVDAGDFFRERLKVIDAPKQD